MYTDMSEFFKAIASRMWKENDLSDMTFALCQSNIDFKKFFLDYFFPNDDIDPQKALFQREFAVEGARPDFWINVNDEVYLVEVKIWDRNHHFKQYHDVLTSECNIDAETAYGRIGYIANYHISPQEAGYKKDVSTFKKFQVREWTDFYRKLEERVSVDDFAGGDFAIVGYLHYLRRLCSIKKFDAETPVGRELLETIAWLEDSTARAIKECRDTAQYNRSSSCIDLTWRKGRFFTFEVNGSVVYAFIGVYFGAPSIKDGEPCIAVVIEDSPGWGKIACDKHRSKVRKNGLWFYPNQDDLDCLAEFLGRVVSYVRGTDESIYPGYDPQMVPQSVILRNIRLYDRMMKLKVLSFSDVERGFTVEYYPNPRVQDGGFGEYFQINVPSRSIRVWAWTGFEKGVRGPVIRFRGDWDKQGIFSNETERVILDQDNVTIAEYAEAFRVEVTKLIVSHIEGL